MCCEFRTLSAGIYFKQKNVYLPREYFSKEDPFAEKPWGTWKQKKKAATKIISL